VINNALFEIVINYALFENLESGIFKVVVVARATHPPEGLHPNQAQLASPMV
jgi:hypothetical protein